MTTSTTFTTGSFGVTSAQQVTYNIVRVTFNAKPRSVSSNGFNDALNVNNYVFTGPSSIVINAISPTNGDTNSVDLLLNSPIVLGAYSLAVNNILAG